MAMDGRIVGITDLRMNTKQIVGELDDRPLTVVSRSKPVAVILRPDRYEDLLDRLDELTIALRHAQDGDESDPIPLEQARAEILGEDEPPESVDASPAAATGRRSRGKKPVEA